MLRGASPAQGRGSHLASRPGHTPQRCSPARGHSARRRAAGRTSSSPRPAGEARLRGGSGEAAPHPQPRSRAGFRLPNPRGSGVTWSRLRARRVFPVYTSSRWSLRVRAKPSGTEIPSTSTRSGSRAFDLPILIPGTSPPTWSCQPPPAGHGGGLSLLPAPTPNSGGSPQSLPVVSLCSRCSTAWMRDSVLAALPAARYSEAITAPARMLLVPVGRGRVRAARGRTQTPPPILEDVPRPEPWGSLDQVCTSKPPPKLRISWARRGSCEGNCTIWVQMKAAFSKAPGSK